MFKQQLEPGKLLRETTNFCFSTLVPCLYLLIEQIKQKGANISLRNAWKTWEKLLKSPREGLTYAKFTYYHTSQL